MTISHIRFLFFCILGLFSQQMCGQLIGGDILFRDRPSDHMLRHKDNTLVTGTYNFNYTNFIVIGQDGLVLSDTIHIKNEASYDPLYYDILSYGKGYVFAGYHNTAKYVEYLDEKLNVIWKTTLFNENEFNQFTILTEKENHNIIYITWKPQKLYVAEIDSTGHKINENEFQTVSDVTPISSFCYDDHIYIYGHSGASLYVLNEDLSLFKTINLGNAIGQNTAVIKAILADTDRILLCTAKSDFAGLLPYEDNLCLTMIDKNGEIIWQQFYSGELPIVPRDIVKTNDGGFLISGTAYNSPTAEYEYQLNYDYLFIKYSQNGQLLWINTYGTSRNEYCEKILARNDGRFDVLAKVPSGSFYFVVDSTGSRNNTQSFTADSGFFSAHAGNWTDINKDGQTDLLSNLEIFYSQENGSFNLHQDLFPLYGQVVYDRTTFGDYDNDGDLDLFLASSSGYRFNFDLLKNNQGFFVIDTLAGLSAFADENFGSSWIDINNDGFLDLFTANKKCSYLHMNNGKGGFVTTRFPDNIIQYGPYRDDYYVSKHQWIHLNNDKFPDLLLVYKDLDAPLDSQFRARVYANFGGSFKEVTDSWEVIKNKPVQYLIWDDIDNDLDDDVMIFEKYYETVCENSDGKFQNVRFDSHHYTKHGLRGNFIDFDNDGDQDIIVDRIAEGYKEVFRNDGKYFNQTWDHVLTGPFDFKPSEQWADINSDGFPDFANTGWYPGTAFMNNTNGNNWIKIRLQGNASNYDGIGAIIKLRTSGENPFWQKQQITAENALSSLFGLRDALIDSIIVEWPSHCVTKIGKISEVNKEILITENCSGIPPVVRDTTICYGASVLINPKNGSNYNWYYSLNDEEPFYQGKNYTFESPDSSWTYFISNADSMIESRKVPFTLNLKFPVETHFSDTLISFNQVLFKNQSLQADKYSWDFGDGTFSELKNPVHTYMTDGLYYVTLKASNSCFEEQVTDTLLINTNTRSNKVILYPVPVSEKLFVLVPELSFDNEDQLMLRIFDLNGKEIYSQFMGKMRYEIINMQRFKSGKYVIVIENNKSKRIAGNILKIE